jgi:hypothetical protein
MNWFDRSLDRELGPAPRRAAREPWLRDWPLLLGLFLSAALIAGSLAVRGPHAKPAKSPTAATSAAAAIPGEVVDVGEDPATDAPEAAGEGDTPAAEPAKKKKKNEKSTPSSGGASAADPAGESTDTPHGGGTASGGASEGSNAGGARPGSNSGGSTSAPGRRPSNGGGAATPGKIVNVTGTSAAFTNGPLSYAFRAPTHSPVVGKPWILSISAKRSGKPMTGRVKIDILHQGSVVGHAADGALTNGRFAHKFDWPARSVGHPLTVKTTVVGGGYQQSFLFNVKVKQPG